MQDKVSITNQTNGKPPRLPFVRLKNAILGKSYELSVAYVTRATSRCLNMTHRQKDKPTNVLSFPLSKNSGELVIDLTTSRKESSLFDMTERNFIKFLVIHGMLHLKGYEHSSTMERLEKKFLKLFAKE